MPSFRLESAARSHVGKVRTLNEDRFLDRSDAGLWAVADGMGGHFGGEVAASMLIDALGKLEAFSSGYAHLNGVRESIQEVNRALLCRAANMPGAGIIGSTIVALLIQEGHYACIWAGDSRAYRRRQGRFERITRDHSLVQELVDAKLLSPEDARHHPRANVITRAVGVAEKLVEEIRHAQVEPGDLFLLCSDGLTAMLGDAEIDRLLDEQELDRAADDLLNVALERGAHDNVTFVLVRAASDRKP